MKTILSLVVAMVMWTGVASALDRVTIVHDSHDNFVFKREKVVQAPDQSSTMDGGFGADAEQYGGTGNASTMGATFEPLSSTQFNEYVALTRTWSANGVWHSTGIGVQSYKSGVLSVEGIGVAGTASATINVYGSNSATEPTDSQDGILLQPTIHTNGMWVYDNLPRWLKVDVDGNSTTLNAGWKLFNK